MIEEIGVYHLDLSKGDKDYKYVSGVHTYYENDFFLKKK